MKFDSVLSGIKPTPAEAKRVSGHITTFLKELNKRLAKHKAKAILGGSFAKDTWLDGDYDVDVFATFDLSAKGQDLSAMLEQALKPWKPLRIHGSRDYFWVRDEIRYEIIPVLAIKKAADAQNVTDFSPKHVTWAVPKLKKLKDDVRLAKQWCKSQRVYGAESYIRGFSGHVLDILVIHYGGFLKMLRAGAKWRPKTIIDTNNVHKGKALLALNASKTQGPLIVVDPVQPDRNAAAAMTQERYDRFIKAAQAFVKKPHESFFLEQKPDYDALAKRGTLVKINVQTLNEKEDVAGTKMVRAYDTLKEKLTLFNVIASDWEWDRKKDGVLWYVLKNARLPDTEERRGPPLDRDTDVNAFKKKYRNTFTRDKRSWARVKRENTTPTQTLSEALRDTYITSRLANAKLERSR